MERVLLSEGGGVLPASRSGAAPGLQRGLRVGRVVVEELLGSGWEASVYRVRAKAGRGTRVLKCYRKRPGVGAEVAKRVRHLQGLQGCQAVPGLERQVRLVHGREEWPALLLQYAPGTSLLQLLRRRPSRRLNRPEAVAVMRAVVRALGSLHDRGSYHGDLHEGNILVRRCGRGLRAHLVDPFPHRGSVAYHQRCDVVEAVRTFYYLLGGAAAYSRQPAWVKDICRGLRSELVLRQTPDAHALLRKLERAPVQPRPIALGPRGRLGC